METSLTGQLLVAMPSLKDPNFERAVVCICSHNEQGAMGIVINRPHPVAMDVVLAQLGITWKRLNKLPLFLGGPVNQERGFIIYEQNREIPGFMEITDDLFIGANPEVLRHLVQESDAEHRFLFALGYAGWGDGQLEHELRANSWLVCRLSHELLFDVPPEQRWSTALSQMGIDPIHMVEASLLAN